MDLVGGRGHTYEPTNIHTHRHISEMDLVGGRGHPYEPTNIHTHTLQIYIPPLPLHYYVLVTTYLRTSLSVHEAWFTANTC